jgi:hypothetical protein
LQCRRFYTTPPSFASIWKKIASVVSLSRKDIVTQSLRGNDNSVDFIQFCNTPLFVIPGSWPGFGLIGDQTIQYPPPSLRDTSASGGHWPRHSRLCRN